MQQLSRWQWKIRNLLFKLFSFVLYLELEQEQSLWFLSVQLLSQRSCPDLWPAHLSAAVIQSSIINSDQRRSGDLNYSMKQASGKEGISYVSAMVMMLLQGSCFPIREEECILSVFSYNEMSSHPFLYPFSLWGGLHVLVSPGLVAGPKRRPLLVLPQWSRILVSNPTSMLQTGQSPSVSSQCNETKESSFLFTLCSNQSFLIICASLL